MPLPGAGGADDAAVVVVADGAEHDHRGAVGELGVVDPVALAVAGVHGEAEGPAEPVDHGGGVAVAEGREDAGGFGASVAWGLSWLVVAQSTRGRARSVLKICYPQPGRRPRRSG